jgi:hypothetical protein
MSFIGTGDEDWVELDFDLFERNRSRILETALYDNRRRLVDTLGFDFQVETEDDLVYIVVDGRRRFRAEVGRDDRLIFTGLPDPEGPL